MRSHSPLVVDVLEVLESPGTRKSIAFSAEVPGLDMGLAHAGPEIAFDLVAEAIDGGIWVDGTVRGSYHAECRRCLGPVEQPFSLRAGELYRPASEAWEEGYVIKETTIDLEPLVRDAVMLDLPANPLCREDCAGLCHVCGKNLNEEPHAHAPEVDVRWSALKDLRPTD
jgi:uncharacterized protein